MLRLERLTRQILDLFMAERHLAELYLGPCARESHDSAYVDKNF